MTVARLSLCLVLLFAVASFSLASCSDDNGSGSSKKKVISDEDSESRAHYRSSSWDPSSEAAQRVDAALAGRASLTPTEFAQASPSILPPGMIHRPLKDDEVYRIIRNFVPVVPPSELLPQKPNATEVAAAIAGASSLSRDVLVSVATNVSGAFMALADSSQGGVVNKEHEYPAWAARDDPYFDLERWGSDAASIPESIDRAFDRADWTSDQRRGINASAAQRLGFGDPVSELYLAMDADGDGLLTAEELSSTRMPADTPFGSLDSSGRRHPVYGYTRRNGELLAEALVRAYDADGDGKLSKEKRQEAFDAVEALAALRASRGTASRASGSRLAAALVLGDSYNASSSAGPLLTDKLFASYASRAKRTGEMAVTPPEVSDGGDGAVSSWFEKATGGKRSVTVEEFVSGSASR